MLAIKGDPGTDSKLLEEYLAGTRKQILRQFSGGLGSGGYFNEGAGPGQITTDTAFVPMLQAMKIAGGRDYISPRPHAQFTALRWVMWLKIRDGRAWYPMPQTAPKSFQATEDGSLTLGFDGMAVGVDFSKASGADGVIVMTGGSAAEPRGIRDPAKAKYTRVDAGGTIFHVVTFQARTPPEPKADGARLVVGGQTIALQDGKILFGKTARLVEGSK